MFKSILQHVVHRITLSADPCSGTELMSIIQLEASRYPIGHAHLGDVTYNILSYLQDDPRIVICPPLTSSELEEAFAASGGEKKKEGEYVAVQSQKKSDKNLQNQQNQSKEDSEGSTEKTLNTAEMKKRTEEKSTTIAAGIMMNANSNGEMIERSIVPTEIAQRTFSASTEFFCHFVGVSSFSITQGNLDVIKIVASGGSHGIPKASETLKSRCFRVHSLVTNGTIYPFQIYNRCTGRLRRMLILRRFLPWTNKNKNNAENGGQSSPSNVLKEEQEEENAWISFDETIPFLADLIENSGSKQCVALRELFAAFENHFRIKRRTPPEGMGTGSSRLKDNETDLAKSEENEDNREDEDVDEDQKKKEEEGKTKDDEHRSKRHRMHQFRTALQDSGFCLEKVFVGEGKKWPIVIVKPPEGSGATPTVTNEQQRRNNNEVPSSTLQYPPHFYRNPFHPVVPQVIEAVKYRGEKVLTRSIVELRNSSKLLVSVNEEIRARARNEGLFLELEKGRTRTDKGFILTSESPLDPLGIYAGADDGSGSPKAAATASSSFRGNVDPKVISRIFDYVKERSCATIADIYKTLGHDRKTILKVIHALEARNELVHGTFRTPPKKGRTGKCISYVSVPSFVLNDEEAKKLVQRDIEHSTYKSSKVDVKGKNLEEVPRARCEVQVRTIEPKDIDIIDRELFAQEALECPEAWVRQYQCLQNGYAIEREVRLMRMHLHLWNLAILRGARCFSIRDILLDTPLSTLCVCGGIPTDLFADSFTHEYPPWNLALNHLPRRMRKRIVGSIRGFYPTFRNRLWDLVYGLEKVGVLRIGGVSDAVLIVLNATVQSRLSSGSSPSTTFRLERSEDLFTDIVNFWMKSKSMQDAALRIAHPTLGPQSALIDDLMDLNGVVFNAQQAYSLCSAFKLGRMMLLRSAQSHRFRRYLLQRKKEKQAIKASQRFPAAKMPNKFQLTSTLRLRRAPISHFARPNNFLSPKDLLRRCFLHRPLRSAASRMAKSVSACTRPVQETIACIYNLAQVQPESESFGPQTRNHWRKLLENGYSPRPSCVGTGQQQQHHPALRLASTLSANELRRICMPISGSLTATTPPTLEDTQSGKIDYRTFSLYELMKCIIFSESRGYRADLAHEALKRFSNEEKEEAANMLSLHGVLRWQGTKSSYTPRIDRLLVGKCKARNMKELRPLGVDRLRELVSTTHRNKEDATEKPLLSFNDNENGETQMSLNIPGSPDNQKPKERKVGRNATRIDAYEIMTSLAPAFSNSMYAIGHPGDHRYNEDPCTDGNNVTSISVSIEPPTATTAANKGASSHLPTLGKDKDDDEELDEENEEEGGNNEDTRNQQYSAEVPFGSVTFFLSSTSPSTSASTVEASYHRMRKRTREESGSASDVMMIASSPSGDTHELIPEEAWHQQQHRRRTEKLLGCPHLLLGLHNCELLLNESFKETSKMSVLHHQLHEHAGEDTNFSTGEMTEHNAEEGWMLNPQSNSCTTPLSLFNEDHLRLIEGIILSVLHHLGPSDFEALYSGATASLKETTTQGGYSDVSVGQVEVRGVLAALCALQMVVESCGPLTDIYSLNPQILPNDGTEESKEKAPLLSSQTFPPLPADQVELVNGIDDCPSRDFLLPDFSTQKIQKELPRDHAVAEGEARPSNRFGFSILRNMSGTPNWFLWEYFVYTVYDHILASPGVSFEKLVRTVCHSGYLFSPHLLRKATEWLICGHLVEERTIFKRATVRPFGGGKAVGKRESCFVAMERADPFGER